MNEKKVKPFGLKDKIGYMFGDFGNDFTFMFSSTFLMVFYTKVLGISGAAVGTLFLVARFVDAVTDITMDELWTNANRERMENLSGGSVLWQVRWRWPAF